MGCDVVGHTGVLELKLSGVAGRGVGAPGTVVKCGLVQHRDGPDIGEGDDSNSQGRSAALQLKLDWKEHDF